MRQILAGTAIACLIACGVLVSLAAPVLAADFSKVADRGTFLSLLEGRQLRLNTWDVTLNVAPNGQITGSMMGWDVTGSWQWQDGFFCREMDWSGYAIDYNCQLVEVSDSQSLRFTVDQGAGTSAVFQLK